MRVGVLGGERVAVVDGRGTVRPERAGWDLGWWIGADDRWHFPEHEIAVRQSLLDGMPVVTTAMRVPGGDAVARVYGGAPAATVVEVVNDSPAPFVAALVVRGAASVDMEGGVVFVDRRPAVIGVRPPSRWAVTADGTTQRVVTGGHAREGAFAPQRDRAARLEAAFLYPVAHQTTLRFVVPLGPSSIDVESATVPDAQQVARGWRAQLDRGMRVELPDPSLQAAVDTARAQILLAGQAWSPDPAVVAALEDWGFDDEAREAWSRLGVLARRKASRRAAGRPTWDEVRNLADDDDVRFLGALRRALVADAGADLNILATWPDEWRGLPLDVRDVPTRLGPVSFSVRWHDDRAALIWEVPPGFVLLAPGLDPAWSSRDPSGEILLLPTT